MRVNYKPPKSRKEKKQKRIQEARVSHAQDDAMTTEGKAKSSTYDQLISKGLTEIKRK